MSKKIHVRPGKSHAKAGFIIGIIFCLIGLFVVIPTFGILGVLWTALAGWIAYVHYRNVSAAESLFIGDGGSNELYGAKTAGMKINRNL